MLMYSSHMLRPRRTEEAKAYRHLHGDVGCRFADRYLEAVPDPWSNCISTVQKDNLILVTYV